MITQLIDKQDTFEIVRDKIAQILADEFASQQNLAAASGQSPDDWKVRVYAERSNPFEQFLNPPVTDTSPLVNVWYESSTFNQSGSNVSERQLTEGIFYIDCYGYGLAADNPAGGHTPGDKEAALEAHRALRMVRNILMASAYTYLDLRGVVGQRWPQSITVFQPELNSQQVQQVVGARIAFRVLFNEFSPQYQPETLEELAVDIIRAEDGQVLAEADYTYPLPVEPEPLLQVDYRSVFVGGSVTQGTAGVNFIQFFIDGVNSRCMLPEGYNKAIGGNTTQAVLDTLQPALDLNPDMLCVYAGGNDIIAGTPVSTITDNLDEIYRQGIAYGAKIVAITIFPVNGVTPEDEQKRQDINAWIQARTDIVVVDMEGFDPDTMMQVDNIHPNYLGAQYFGNTVAAAVNAVSTSAPYFYRGAQNYLQQLGFNVAMTGDSGNIIAGATGVVADGWTFNYSGDATIVLSKGADDKEQVITISGNNTAVGADAVAVLGINVPVSQAAKYYAAGGITVDNDATSNIDAIAVQFTGFSPNIAPVIATVGPFPDDGVVNSLKTDTIGTTEPTIDFRFAFRLAVGATSGTITLKAPFVRQYLN